MRGKVESLNASVATAVVLYELARRRSAGSSTIVSSGWSGVRYRLPQEGRERREVIWHFADEAHGLFPHPQMHIASIVTYVFRRFV